KHKLIERNYKYIPITVIVGQNVTLECIVANLFKKRNIYWFRNNEYIVPYYDDKPKSKLTFTSVQLHNSANYTCEVKNTEYHVNTTFPLVVEAKSIESNTELVTSTSFRIVHKTVDVANGLILIIILTALPVGIVIGVMVSCCALCFRRKMKEKKSLNGCIKEIEAKRSSRNRNDHCGASVIEKSECEDNCVSPAYTLPMKVERVSFTNSPTRVV
ncbi:hypothetical protein B4U80_14098, partial [Leptotrombidium deliense]